MIANILSEALGNFIVGMAVVGLAVLCTIAIKKHIEKEKN